jgi:hypothetical protein
MRHGQLDHTNRMITISVIILNDIPYSDFTEFKTMACHLCITCASVLSLIMRSLWVREVKLESPMSVRKFWRPSHKAPISEKKLHDKIILHFQLKYMLNCDVHLGSNKWFIITLKSTIWPNSCAKFRDRKKKICLCHSV